MPKVELVIRFYQHHIICVLMSKTKRIICFKIDGIGQGQNFWSCQSKSTFSTLKSKSCWGIFRNFILCSTSISNILNCPVIEILEVEYKKISWYIIEEFFKWVLKSIDCQRAHKQGPQKVREVLIKKKTIYNVHMCIIQHY